MIAVGLLDQIPHRSIVAEHRPWPRADVGEDGWRAAIDHLVAGRLTLLGLWGETAAVHMALLEPDSGDIAIVSLGCASGTFPSRLWGCSAARDSTILGRTKTML